MEEEKIKTKKSLGQNFLKDKGILKKIADFAMIEENDTVVEVGPGEGSLTEFLLEKAQKVIAIEKDKRMVEFLKIKFTNEIKEGKLEVIERDILDLESKKSSVNENFVLVGNIPYYITGALFKKALESENPPKSITFVVQKEVAERIVARDGKESILSISIKAYGEPEYGGVIKAGSFSPAPKVDSAIISIRNINKENFTPTLAVGVPSVQNVRQMEKNFFEVLRAGFAHKRKLLIKNLGVEKENFKKCGIPEKARAEDIKVSDWICLTKELKHN